MENLLEVLRVYRVDRVFLHSLVYVLEKVYGLNIGYGDCSWKIVSTGVYCDDIEEDLEKLLKQGLIRIIGNKIVVNNEKEDSVSIEVRDTGKLVREAINHFLFTETTGRDVDKDLLRHG